MRSSLAHLQREVLDSVLNLRRLVCLRDQLQVMNGLADSNAELAREYESGEKVPRFLPSRSFGEVIGVIGEHDMTQTRRTRHQIGIGKRLTSIPLRRQHVHPPATKSFGNSRVGVLVHVQPHTPGRSPMSRRVV